MDSGRRWLERSKMKTRAQLKRIRRGRRGRRVDRVGGVGEVVRAGPERAPRKPKAELGRTKVGMLLSVKCQIRVGRWWRWWRWRGLFVWVDFIVVMIVYSS